VNAGEQSRERAAQAPDAACEVTSRRPPLDLGRKVAGCYGMAKLRSAFPDGMPAI
jgi:hypothetical protein